MVLPAKSVPSMRLQFNECHFFSPLEWPALNQWENLGTGVAQVLQIKMDISFGSNAVYQNVLTLLNFK